MPEYWYGTEVALEPGEGMPAELKHEDIEERDSGWDKVDRVHRFALITQNQDVAREQGFDLLYLVGDDDDDDEGEVEYDDSGEIPCSWGTFDCRTISHGEYVYGKAGDGPPVDIYTNQGAAVALRAERQAQAVYAKKYAQSPAGIAAAEQRAEIEARVTAEIKAREEREAALAAKLREAGIEPTPWAVEVARSAAVGADRTRLAQMHVDFQAAQRSATESVNAARQEALGQVDRVLNALAAVRA